MEIREGRFEFCGDICSSLASGEAAGNSVSGEGGMDTTAHAPSRRGKKVPGGHFDDQRQTTTIAIHLYKPRTGRQTRHVRRGLFVRISSEASVFQRSPAWAGLCPPRGRYQSRMIEFGNLTTRENHLRQPATSEQRTAEHSTAEAPAYT